MNSSTKKPTSRGWMSVHDVSKETGLSPEEIEHQFERGFTVTTQKKHRMTKPITKQNKGGDVRTKDIVKEIKRLNDLIRASVKLQDHRFGGTCSRITKVERAIDRICRKQKKVK